MNGGEYHPNYSTGDSVTPGELIGVCQWTAEEHPMGTNRPENVEICATLIPSGTEVYQWQGYDQSFRVCAEMDGRLWGFTRQDEDYISSLGEEKLGPEDLYGDISEKIDTIVIKNNEYSLEVGRISDAAEAAAITKSIMSQSFWPQAYEQLKWNNETDKGASYKLAFESRGETIEAMYFYSGGLARMSGGLFLPGNTLEALLDAVVYTGDCVPTNAINGGIVTGNELEYWQTDGLEDWQWSTIFSAYIDPLEGSGLYLNRLDLQRPGWRRGYIRRQSPGDCWRLTVDDNPP